MSGRVLRDPVIVHQSLGGGAADVDPAIQERIAATGEDATGNAVAVLEAAAEVRRNPLLSAEGRRDRIAALAKGAREGLKRIRSAEPYRWLVRERSKAETAVAHAMSLPRDTTPETLREVRDVYRALPETERLDRMREAAYAGDTIVLAALAEAPPSLRLVPDEKLDEARAIAARVRAPEAVERLEHLEGALELAEANVDGTARQLARLLDVPVGPPPEPRMVFTSAGEDAR